MCVIETLWSVHTTVLPVLTCSEYVSFLYVLYVYTCDHNTNHRDHYSAFFHPDLKAVSCGSLCEYEEVFKSKFNKSDISRWLASWKRIQFVDKVMPSRQAGQMRGICNIFLYAYKLYKLFMLHKNDTAKTVNKF